MRLEPTLDEDVAYGFRLLVDIAERSLADSPFQDPTTAVQAIDRLHDVLRQLARRPFPDGRHRDAEGEVTARRPLDELGGLRAPGLRRDPHGGRGIPQVSRRLTAALEDLRSIAPSDRVEVVDEQLELLATATTRAMEDERDVELALHPDREGIGAAIAVER